MGISMVREGGAKKMKICLIGCWYRDDIYSHHLSDVMTGLRNEGHVALKLVTSNCNCFSSSQKFGCTREELLDNHCEIIELPFAPAEPSKAYGAFRYHVTKVFKLNWFLETIRGLLFFRKTKGFEIIHFDQVLRSFGVLSFRSLLVLSKLFKKKVIVEIHELDPLQISHKAINKIYDKADKIVTHSNDLKNELVKLGIGKEKIIIIPYATSLPDIRALRRTQFIFFGGHKLLKGKGFDILLKATQSLKSMGRKIKLLIYVGEGCIGLEEGINQVTTLQLDDCIAWSEFLHGPKLNEAYQRSIACLIPYTGGSGRYAATVAMANGTPVIATRKASLPEYLGDLGIYVKDNSSQELADAMIYLMENLDTVKSLGEKLRKRAEANYSANVIGERTLQIYREVIGIL